MWRPFECTRLLQGSSPPRCEPHRLDAPVGVRRPLDHTGALQEAHSARQVRHASGDRQAVVFLASDDGSDVTGTELCVDGGFAQV